MNRCDEAKPTCNRCHKSGRECGGYKHRAPAILTLPTTADSQTVPSQDHDLLIHFLSEATDHLSGFSPPLKQFCIGLATQLGQGYPAVRFALLSTAARTQAAALRWDSSRHRSEALHYKSTSLVYYNHAIRHLTSPATHVVPGEVYLVCSLLFAATEMWPHRYMAPSLHVISAFRLFLSGAHSLRAADAEIMRPLIIQLGRKILALSEDVPDDLAPQIREAVWMHTHPPPLSQSFTSTMDAWAALDLLLNYISALSMGPDENFVSATLADMQQYSAQTHQSLLNSRDIHDPDDTHHQVQYRSLLMHQRTLQLLLDVSSADDEGVYDLYTVDFEYILGECEALLLEEKVRHQQNPKNGWHTTLGFLAPLFIVATKCRIPALRHRAIKALHSSRRREREWNSCIAAMLARFVVHTEEKNRQAGQIGNVGAEFRIRLLSVEFKRETEQMAVNYFNPATQSYGCKTLSWKPRDGIDDDFEHIKITGCQLAMGGYGGIMLVRPPIHCQCGSDD
jgi:hypothetical protein